MDSINSELNRTLEFNEQAAAATVERLTQHVLELESKITCLENELLAFSSKDTIELEARLSSLADSLEKQQQEGSQAIEIWHLRFTELSDAMNELKVDYEALSNEKQLIETTTREVNEMMENERALNESLSMQIHAMDKELSSTKAMLVSISEEGERAAEALRREIDKNAETISAHEARAITLEKLLGDLRSEMDNVRSAAEQSLETAQGKKHSLFSAWHSILSGHLIHLQFTVRSRELESALESAKQQLEMRERDAIAALAELKMKIKGLDDERFNAFEELGVERVAREASEEREVSCAL